MYKIVIERNNRILAMDIEEMVTKGIENAHTCPIEALHLENVEILN